MPAPQLKRRFVDALPADPEPRNFRRQVQGACYSLVEPTPVPQPELLAWVPEVAELLSLPAEPSPEWVQALAGNRVLDGMVPYAQCYGGHQFGHWAGQLGDGRAITLAELDNGRGETWEVQLKGAGPTPYSRTADGRAVLRSSLRELVCSEAMFHLGVPTTRALSLVLTGQDVIRDMLYDGNPRAEPGAVVCRVAPSFLRFGSYELPAVRDDLDTLRALVSFTLEHYFPQLRQEGTLAVAALFEEVCVRTARLICEWMRVGFVHGVMNTDNMSILGLTIDYGPYGWVEPFDPGWTPNTTDASGRRYRFGNQPKIAYWNLAQLAGALAPLLEDVAPLEHALDVYIETLAREQRRMLLAKLGLTERPDRVDEDNVLVTSLLSLLTATETDMTLFHRRLADLSVDERSADAHLSALRDAYYDADGPSGAVQKDLATFTSAYLVRAAQEGATDAERRARMNRVNPIYVPRNYLLQEVIDKTEAGDREALPQLLDVLRRPYDERPGLEAFARKRPEWARHRAGCSMLSCSS
ncbi:MAG: YdiU family protein [Polyangiaceae bacterium]|nr:YdiU family protein [Polyangiaceae bacterium]